MVDHEALARALHEVQAPKPPEQFDYSLSDMMARAQDGSTLDARALLLLIIAMLRKPAPAPLDGVALLPLDVAEYLAGALNTAVLTGKADDALHLGRKRGRNKYANEQRNRWVKYFAEWFRHSGRKDYLAATAAMLNEARIPSPSGATHGRWTGESVGDAIKALQAGNK